MFSSRDVPGTFHHCILQEPGEDQYYIAYHRFARPSADHQGKNGFYRKVCLDLLELDENSKIKTVEKH